MNNLHSVIESKAYAEYHLSCEDEDENECVCSNGLVCASINQLVQAFKRHGWELVDGKVYCKKCAKARK